MPATATRRKAAFGVKKVWNHPKGMGGNTSWAKAGEFPVMPATNQAGPNDIAVFDTQLQAQQAIKRLKPQKDTEFQVAQVGGVQNKAASRRRASSRSAGLNMGTLTSEIKKQDPDVEIETNSVGGTDFITSMPLAKAQALAQKYSDVMTISAFDHDHFTNISVSEVYKNGGYQASRSAGLGGLFVHFMNSVLKKPQGQMQNKVNRLRQKYGENWDEIGKDILIEIGGELNMLAQKNSSTDAAKNMVGEKYGLDQKMVTGLWYAVGAPFQDSGAQFDMLKIKESKAAVLRTMLQDLQTKGTDWDEAKPQLLQAINGLKINPKDKRTLQMGIQGASNYEKAESALVYMEMKHQGMPADILQKSDATASRQASDLGEAVDSLVGDVKDPNWIQLSEVFDRLHSRHPNDPKVTALGQALVETGVSGNTRSLSPYVQQYLKAQPATKAAARPVPMIVVAYTIPWVQKAAIRKAQLAFRRSAGIRLATSPKGLLVVADHNALAVTGMTSRSAPGHVRFARSAGQVLSSIFHQHMSGIVTADIHVALSAPAARRYASHLVRNGGIHSVLVWDISGTPHLASRDSRKASTKKPSELKTGERIEDPEQGNQWLTVQKVNYGGPVSGYDIYTEKGKRNVSADEDIRLED